MFLKYTGFLNLNDVGTNVVEPPLSVDVLISEGCKYLLPSGTILGPGIPLITSLICIVTPLLPEAGLVLKYSKISLTYIPPSIPSTLNVCANGSPKNGEKFKFVKSITGHSTPKAKSTAFTAVAGAGSGCLVSAAGVVSAGGCGPGAPVSPVGPAGPVFPTGPVGPVCPTGPGEPTGPGGPTISIVSCIITGAGGGGIGVPCPIEMFVETSVTTLLSECCVAFTVAVFNDIIVSCVFCLNPADS